MITPNFVEQFKIYLESTPTCPAPYDGVLSDLSDRVFNCVGPALVNLARTCTTYQNFVESKYKIQLQKYRQAIKLMNDSYLQSATPENDSDKRAVDKTCLGLTRALTLISLKSAEEIAKRANKYQCHAFLSLAKACLTQNDTMAYISRAIESGNNISKDSKKFKALAPVLKILESLDKELMLKTANSSIEYEDGHFLYPRYEATALCANILYKSHPENVSKMITKALEKVKSFKYKHLCKDRIDNSIAHLLPAYALFDADSALKETHELSDNKRRSVIVNMIDVMSMHNPQKALDLRNLALTETPSDFEDLITYAKALTFCDQHGTASQMIEKAKALLEVDSALKKFNYLFNANNRALTQGLASLKMAKILILFDRKAALEMVQKALSLLILENSDTQRCLRTKDLAELLIDLNDENSIVNFTKYAFPRIKNLNVDKPKYKAISTLATALAPFNWELALEMCESIDNTILKSLAHVNMSLRVFEQTG